MRRRHHPRGTKRGRPRGSTRRGGGHGSLQRVPTPTSPAIGSGTTASPLPTQQEAGGGSHEAAAATTSAAAASGASVPQNEEGKCQRFVDQQLPALECHLSLIAVIITFIALPFYLSSASSVSYYLASPFSISILGTARILFISGGAAVVRDNFSTAQNIFIISLY